MYKTSSMRIKYYAYQILIMRMKHILSEQNMYCAYNIKATPLNKRRCANGSS